MTQYKIQIGSWTKLPNGQVQEDTRDIMKMMGEVCNVNLETYIVTTGNAWVHLGVLDAFHSCFSVHKGEPHVVLYDVPSEDYVIQNKPSLFIPYEELQKMLNEPQEQGMHKVSSLLNTKLDCRKLDGSVDEELSRAFQEAVTGGDTSKYSGWAAHEDIKDHYTKYANFIFVSEDGMISLMYKDEESYFNKHKNKQINFKYSRKLEWEATVVEPTTPEPVDEMVSICGVEYAAKELKEALDLIGKAKK